MAATAEAATREALAVVAVRPARAAARRRARAGARDDDLRVSPGSRRAAAPALRGHQDRAAAGRSRGARRRVAARIGASSSGALPAATPCASCPPTSASRRASRAAAGGRAEARGARALAMRPLPVAAQTVLRARGTRTPAGLPHATAMRRASRGTTGSLRSSRCSRNSRRASPKRSAPASRCACSRARRRCGCDCPPAAASTGSAFRCRRAPAKAASRRAR